MDDKNSSKEEITIYWAPNYSNADNESWSLAFPDPVSVYSEVRRNIPTAAINKCPSFRSLFKKVYAFRSAVDEDFELPIPFMREIAHQEGPTPLVMNPTCKLGLIKIRPTGLEGFANVEYGPSWALFASKPLKIRLTAPYYPVYSPVEGAYLSAGEFDIGRWYRPLVVDYHVPLDKEGLRFTLKKKDPIVFIEAFTDANIVFKRYDMNSKLSTFLKEGVVSSLRYNSNVSLEERYEMAEESQLRERVLKQINQCLVD